MAGNMFMGALLDAGLSRKALEAGLAALPLDFKLKVSRVDRGGFAARYVDVVIPGRRKPKKSAGSGHRRQAHVHAHAHPHEPHVHDHTHAHADSESEHHLSRDDHGRTYAEIVDLLEGASLADGVRRRALGIFEGLARAEARVHGRTLESVHFHEVGMVDAIVDVTAAALGLDLLEIERVTCSPVGIGHGFVDTAHGRLAIPTPATLALLEGVPTVPVDVAWETITPTGAAIVKALTDEFVPWTEMTMDAVGHGAGRERPGATPNIVRLVIGRTQSTLSSDRIAVIETNLDDLVPEHFDHLLERLMESGAVDVSVQHVVMKKNRPGFLVRVLCAPSARDTVARTLFAESTAIGLRHQEWDRLLLERRIVRVETVHGRIRVKEIVAPESGVSYSAEYDDCKRAARRTGVPLRVVVEVAETAARQVHSAKSGAGAPGRVRTKPKRKSSPREKSSPRKKPSNKRKKPE